MDKRIYFCIDLKTFYASVECVERNLDPFKTNLVVADPSRGKGAICLAISPALKNLGIRNRCRLFEIPPGVKYITAKPRMKKYIEYSASVYAVYLKYIAKEDIHPYSIDEMFLDVTQYLKLYKMSAISLAKKILQDVLKTTKITATCGIGTNLFLAKIALDIEAKHSKTNIAFLDENLFKQKMWTRTPLTDFWHIGKGITNHLSRLGIHTLKDIASADKNLLFKEFGINAEILIDHANGIEPTTIKDIKNYEAKSESISQSQILFRDYSYSEAKVVLTEMIDALSLELINQHKVCSNVGLSIIYSKNCNESTGGSRNLRVVTNVYSVIKEKIFEIYNSTTIKDLPIRKIGISFNNLYSDDHEQLDLLTNVNMIKKERNTQITVNKIKKKFGKNSILRGTSLKKRQLKKLEIN